MLNKLTFIIIGIIGLVMLLNLASWITEKLTPRPESFNLGVSFSPNYASELGLDWQKTYQSILGELEVKNLRLSTFWDQLEPAIDQYDFKRTDYLMDEAHKHQAKVILVVGIKQPRWPECHQPDWAIELPAEQRRQRLLKFVEVVVQRYKEHPSLSYWQVENEPFFQFGTECEILDHSLLAEEVKLVRSLDSKHPIIVTDSGEAMKLSITSMRMSDIFGSTLYRTVYAPKVGYFDYPLLPGFYTLKSNLTRLLTPNNQMTIISELQAEPWSTKPLQDTPLADQLKQLPPEKLKDHLEFAKRTGFNTIYLWGVEWWVYMKEKGHPDYWNFAKTLF